MTWREYVLAVRGFSIKRAHAFEHTRAIVYNILAVNRDSTKAFPSIEKFWPLPTDNLDVDKDYEAGEEKRLLAILERAKANMKS